MRQLWISTLLLIPAGASAWDGHRLIHERLMPSIEASGKVLLTQKVRVPCQDEERREAESLAKAIGVNSSKIPLHSTVKCGKKSASSETTVRELLLSDWVDEPDFGMDQDLPESADPAGDRAWMGGTTGPTSQGFRHMMFPGFEWSSPLRTLQIPFRPVGQALERIRALRSASDRYRREKNLFWALRILNWELHLIQDLHQPFHVTQVPAVRMLPWKSLFSGFVARSTRTMANYHFAYEGLAQEMLRERAEGTLGDCLAGTESRVFQDPVELMREPRAEAPGLGQALLRLLGDYPKSTAVNLPEGVGAIDYFKLIRGKPLFVNDEESDYLNSEEKREIERSAIVVGAVDAVKVSTCGLFRLMGSYTRGELERFFADSSISIHTGK
jgi:hypothetical protein